MMARGHHTESNKSQSEFLTFIANVYKASASHVLMTNHEVIYTVNTITIENN